MAKQSPWTPPPQPTFAAIDFETADRHSDSACAIGLVRVEAGAITAVVHRLIRPPRRGFEHSWVHGITWQDVADAPVFIDVWRELQPLLHGCAFLVAHNAGFERKVLTTSLTAVGEPMPTQPLHCTVQLARRTWQLQRANLPTVSALIGYALRHHDAASDAEACARIVLAAASGWQPQRDGE